MGTTTFSGPILAGTIKNTTGTTVGSNIKNTGQVVMAQSFTTGSLAGGASGPNTTDVVIPAKSQIIDCVIDCPTAMGANTAVLSIGDTVGGAATIINQFSITTGSGAGRKYPTTEAGGALTWAETSNTTDIRLTWTTTGATNAGEIRVTVLYQQASNLVA
jgi:hypothetical protein